MSNVYFIADLHFGHRNMAIRRGFKDEFEHDEFIIKNWNKVINKKDTVYILGDITMETTKWYFRLDELVGKKKVILGNHDMINHTNELLKYVEAVSGIQEYHQTGHEKAFITHCPIHPRELEYRVKYNIHGHLHEYKVLKNIEGAFVPDERYINVSCEQIDFTPISYKKLIPKWQ